MESGRCLINWTAIIGQGCKQSPIWQSQELFNSILSKFDKHFGLLLVKCSAQENPNYSCIQIKTISAELSSNNCKNKVTKKLLIAR